MAELWKSLGTVLEEEFTEQAIRSRPKRLKTGFPTLDRMLGGGIAPGLTVLGGSPSLGKSTFALQVAERVSWQGTPALYFSMEMAAEKIAAKTLSRQLFRSDGCARGITAEYLLNGEFAQLLSSEQFREIDAARAASDGKDRLYLVDDLLSAEEIADAVLEFIKEHGERPLVVVDYLQILPWSGIRTKSEKQAVEDSLRQMILLAKSGVPVILISSLNRSSYKGSMQLDAFKETGGIEYSADVLLGLQFTACHEGPWDINVEKSKVPRDVELVILKQRYGISGGAVQFQYYAQYDCFLEVKTSTSAAVELPVPPIPALAEPPVQQAVSEAASAPVPAPVPAPASASAPTPTSAPTPAVPESGEPVPEPDPPERRAYKGPVDYINNTMVATEIRQGKCAVGVPVVCRVFGRSSPVAVQYTLSQRLTCFDCAVADTLYTLYHNGHDGFSLSLLLGALCGDSAQTLTKSKKEALLNSLQRLRTATLDIDCTQEMRERRAIGPEEEKVFSGPFLAAAEDGKGGYRFQSEDGLPPLPLYAYGELSGQMIGFPRQLLAVYAGDKKMPNTLERIVVKRFLIRRLEVLGNPKNKSKLRFLRDISFARSGSAAAELGLSGGRYGAKAARGLCRTACSMLDYYQQIGYVKAYSFDEPSLTISVTVNDSWKQDGPQM